MVQPLCCSPWHCLKPAAGCPQCHRMSPPGPARVWRRLRWLCRAPSCSLCRVPSSAFAKQGTLAPPLLLICSTKGLKASPARKSCPGDSARAGAQAGDVILSNHSGKGVSLCGPGRGGEIPKQPLVSPAACTEGVTHAMQSPTGPPVEGGLDFGEPVAGACGSRALLKCSRRRRALGRAALTFPPPSCPSSSTRGSWRRTPTPSGTSA